MLWFKHYSDSRRHPKLLRVERKIGESGYARFFKLLEIVADRGGLGARFKPEIDLNGAATDLEWLASELGIDEGAARETLDLFASVGLIDEGAWAHSILAIPAMLEYRDEYTGRRQKLPPTPERKNSSPEPEVEKEKRVVVEVDSDSETEKDIEKEQNGERPDTIPTVSGQDARKEEVFDQEERYFELKGAAWKRLGIRRLQERYRLFVSLCVSNQPRTDEKVGAWGGRILDLCSTQGVIYPPEFLAIIRRYRKEDKYFFTFDEQMKKRAEARGKAPVQ